MIKEKKKPAIKIFLSFIILLSSFPTYAFSDCFENPPLETKIDSVFTKSFNVKLNDNVDFRNKYGSISVEQWDKDSVSVEVSIQVQHKKAENARKIKDRIEVDFQQVGNQLVIETKFDGKSTAVIGMLKGAGDYSNKVFGKKPMQIDFTVRVPSYVQLKVDQKYGVVSLGDLDVKAQITVQDGTLEASSLSKDANFELRSSTARIKKVDYAFIDSKSTNLSIEKAKKIDIQSAGGEVNVNLVEELYLDANNGKVNISDVKKFSGKSEMAKVNISKLGEELKFTNLIGDFNLDEVIQGFKGIELESKLAEVKINFQKSAVVDFDVKCKAEKLTLPSPDSGLKKAVINKEIHVTGLLGEDKSKAGKLKLTAPSGKIIIGIK